MEWRDSLEDLEEIGIDRKLPKLMEAQNQSAISVEENGNSDKIDVVHGTEQPDICICE